MNLLRRSLDGLSPIEARIDLQLLHDSWRHSPGSIFAQIGALGLLGWMVHPWAMAHWTWVLPAIGNLLIWATVALLLRHFKRFGITATGYGRWRMRLLWWHLLESTMWGLIAVALLGSASPDWRMAIVTAVIIYGYSIVLVTIHDWGVAVVGSLPVMLLVAARLMGEASGSAHFLAMVLVVSMGTCVGVSLSVNRRLREAVLLRHENAGLVMQLREEISKVTEAKGRAEAADRQKGEFFAAASHDLRQPLHVMMLLGSALKPRLRDPDSLGLLHKLQTTLSSMSAMFEQMFLMARLEAQRQEHRAVPLPLADMWARLDTEFSVLCHSKGLHWHMVPTREWVHADAHVLERILRNLLNNAVRYTHAGGVLLRARKRGPWVQCQVWDSGVGVPRQYRHRIFDDHFQAHNDGRLSSEGLGLGPAVVRRLSLLGPTPVRVRSRPGRGSCFSVRLPRLVPAEVLPEAHDRLSVPTPVAMPPADAPIDGAGARTVVLIDDDPQVREGTALALAQHGWLCAAAANPEDALALLARWQDEGRMPAGDMPCALVSDHRLGLSVTGLEALQQLRYELGEDLPALLLTGEIPALLADAAARANVALASKPLSAEQLSDWLATHTQAAPSPRTTAPHAA